METVVKNIEFHPKQLEAFNFETQFGAAICGSQSGKTTMGCYWAAKMINDEWGKEKPRPGLIGAPTYKILQQSTLAKFFEEFPTYRQFYKKQENVIEIPRGDGNPYVIFVRSFDRPLGVEGMSPGWAWLDEFGQCDAMAWTVVKTRMTVTKGKILITTTPYNMGFLYQDIYKPWELKEDPRISVFSWSSYDNPYASKEHLDQERKRLSPEEFGRRYMGTFTRMHGLVYNLDKWNVVPRQELPFDRVIGGIDWGFHNPAVSVIGIRKDGYYVIDEWSEPGKTTGEIIDAALEMQLAHKVSRWYADSANPENILEANKKGLYCHAFKKKTHVESGSRMSALKHGISAITQLINEHRFFVFEDMRKHLTEFESYHYPEDGAVPVDKMDVPIKGNDHFMDAMRYAITGENPKFNYKPKSKGWMEDVFGTVKKKQTINYQFQ